MSVGFRPGLDQVRTGMLNRRVTLMQPNATADATGYVARDTMTPVRSIWVSIEPFRGEEVRRSDKEISELYVTIKAHYNATKDVREGWWIQQTTPQGTDNYDIRVIEPVNQSRKMIQLTCRLVR